MANKHMKRSLVIRQLQIQPASSLPTAPYSPTMGLLTAGVTISVLSRACSNQAPACLPTTWPPPILTTHPLDLTKLQPQHIHGPSPSGPQVDHHSLSNPAPLRLNSNAPSCGKPSASPSQSLALPTGSSHTRFPA